MDVPLPITGITGNKYLMSYVLCLTVVYIPQSWSCDSISQLSSPCQARRYGMYCAHCTVCSFPHTTGHVSPSRPAKLGKMTIRAKPLAFGFSLCSEQVTSWY